MTKFLLASAAVLALTFPGIASAECGVMGDVDGDGNFDQDDVDVFYDIAYNNDYSGYGHGSMLRCLDLNCDQNFGDASDWGLSVYLLSGTPLALDSNQNGIYDTCECDPANVPLWPLGDLNRDTSVNVADTQCAINLALDLPASDACYGWGANDQCADLNCDGSINVVDVQHVINITLGQGPAQCW